MRYSTVGRTKGGGGIAEAGRERKLSESPFTFQCRTICTSIVCENNWAEHGAMCLAVSCCKVSKNFAPMRALTTTCHCVYMCRRACVWDIERETDRKTEKDMLCACVCQFKGVGKRLKMLRTDTTERGTRNWRRWFYAPIVVRMVPAKKMDWPKLQLGSLDTLPTADTPRLFASTISLMNFSRSSSVNTIQNGQKELSSSQCFGAIVQKVPVQQVIIQMRTELHMDGSSWSPCHNKATQCGTVLSFCLRRLGIGVGGIWCWTNRRGRWNAFLTLWAFALSVSQTDPALFGLTFCRRLIQMCCFNNSKKAWMSPPGNPRWKIPKINSSSSLIFTRTFGAGSVSLFLLAIDQLFIKN